MNEISTQEMKDYMLGSSIFAQGQPENFYKSLILIEDLANRRLKPKLIAPEDLADNALVCQVWQRAGGGHEYDGDELTRFLGPFKEAHERRDWECYGKFLGKLIPELSKALGQEISAYLAYCTSSSQGIVPMYISALEGKPFLDGDCCGTAMIPHLDQVANMEYLPIEVGISPYGEIVTIKGAPPMRARLILENIHHISGYWFVACATGIATWKEYRKAVVKRQASRMIKVGAVVREARSARRDPVKAFMSTAPAYKLFEGRVESFTHQKTGGRVHGDFNIGGTGEFSGHKFRVWYFMENRISWLDGKPYVTIPDINAIVDRDTCECLSVLDHDGLRIVEGMYTGRNVIVLGIAADEKWYEHEGAIGAVNSQLKSYGFNIRHRPLKEIISH